MPNWKQNACEAVQRHHNDTCATQWFRHVQRAIYQC